MSIRLIVSDCDGTALDDQKKLDAGLKEVLPVLRELGIEFTFATGRNMEIVMPMVKELDLHLPIITNGGAEIYDGERYLVKHAIVHSELKRIIEWLEKHQIRSVYYSNDCLYTRYADEVNEYFLKRMQGKVAVKSLDDVTRLEAMDLFKIVIIEPEDDLLTSTAAFVNTLPQTHCLLAEDHLCTITHQRASKGNALKELIAYLGIDEEEVVVIGDNHNDCSMFEAFSNSVAMGNATDEIKKAVRIVTEDNNHQGVSKLLWRIVKGEVV